VGETSSEDGDSGKAVKKEKAKRKLGAVLHQRLSGPPLFQVIVLTSLSNICFSG
jgi:hypothetical protein